MLKKEPVVFLDNASTHTCSNFMENIELWEKKGVFIKFLPAYSPELNIIETLWRFMKYWWLPFGAYSSFDNLVNEVENIFWKIGDQFQICFS